MQIRRKKKTAYVMTQGRLKFSQLDTNRIGLTLGEPDRKTRNEFLPFLVPTMVPFFVTGPAAQPN